MIDQARGRVPADLVLRGGTILDMVTGTFLTGNVAICGDVIVGICESYEAREVIDVTGKYLVPGFIDTHLHIESSCVTPFEFDRCVWPPRLHDPLRNRTRRRHAPGLPRRQSVGRRGLWSERSRPDCPRKARGYRRDEQSCCMSAADGHLRWNCHQRCGFRLTKDDPARRAKFGQATANHGRFVPLRRKSRRNFGHWHSAGQDHNRALDRRHPSRWGSQPSFIGQNCGKG